MFLIIALVVGLIVALYAMSKANQKGQSPSPSDEVDIPRNSENAEIIMVLGTRWVKSSNVLHYGDYRTVPIRR